VLPSFMYCTGHSLACRHWNPTHWFILHKAPPIAFFAVRLAMSFVTMYKQSASRMTWVVKNGDRLTADAPPTAYTTHTRSTTP
jgi:hypothetical protein